MSKKEFGNTGPENRGGSSLQDRSSVGHTAQPQGKSIGAGTKRAEHHRNTTFGGGAHAFKGVRGQGKKL